MTPAPAVTLAGGARPRAARVAERQPVGDNLPKTEKFCFQLLAR
jgi:hypothetical protein